MYRFGRAMTPRLPVFGTQHAYDPLDGVRQQTNRDNAEALSPDSHADPGPPHGKLQAMSGTERPLGRSGVSVPALGIGTNRWNTGEPGQTRLNEALAAAVDVGMGFFDTAEIYTFGRSERALGVAARQDGRSVMLASKFAPLPARITAAQFDSALDRTLKRLGRESIDLYYLHFPYAPRGVGTWMKAMAKAVESGKIRAAGISNCNVAQMREAAAVLACYGIALAANQVQYSLLHRAPETNGVLDACRQMDVALIAYRPLAGGAISAGSRKRQGPSALAGTLQEVAAARQRDHKSGGTRLAAQAS